MKEIEHPNGSIEYWCEKPRLLLHIVAPNPYGKTWCMTVQNKVYGAGGNVDGQGIHRRGRKWYPHFEPKVGWSWR